jgi:O-antigen ligase
LNPEPIALRAARWCAIAGAVCALLGIAPSQILLAMAFSALLVSGARLRFPPMWLPMALFMAATVVSLALSDNPGDGVSQVRKFYVWLFLLVIYSAIRDPVRVRWLYLWWGGAGVLSALRSLVQFSHKWQDAHVLGRPFYDYYVVERITGFMSHWMTFSAQMMYVLLGLAAFLFFSPAARWRRWMALSAAAIVAVALLLGFTRSIVFVATPVGLVYLVWFWNRKALVAVPVLAAVGLFAAPSSVRERFTSMFRPTAVDSNEFRKVAWRSGMRMIAEHPWFGLGPERVKARFLEYVPADVPRPLPAGWYGHLHNIYLHFAAERGIPAALVLLWMLGKILFDMLAQIRRLPPGRSDVKFALHATVAIVIATMAEGIFELNLGDSEVLTMFLAAVACGYVARDCARLKETEAAGA